MRALTVALILAVSCTAAVSEPPDRAQQAKASALVFSRALSRSDASMLRPILPSRGKVRLTLVCLGPEEGFFSAGQVEAVFKDFLHEGNVETFRIGRVEGDERGFALVHGHLAGTDREGRPARLSIHLTLQPEDGRWVLREIRESMP